MIKLAIAIKSVVVDENSINLGNGDISLNDIQELAEHLNISIAKALIVISTIQNNMGQNIKVVEDVESTEDIDVNGWTKKQELILVHKLSKRMNITSVAHAMGKSEEEIRTKATNMGIYINAHGHCVYDWRTRKYWKQEEIELLIDYYGTLTSTEIAILTGRTSDAVISKWWSLENPDYISPSAK